MTKPSVPRPTDAELAILRVLWERGACTVRQVHDTLARTRPTAYTTALKMLQIMTEKGLVRRDESDRTHIYQARLSEDQTQRQLVRDLLERAFGGSSSKLVMHALAARRASAEELSEIRKLIDSRDEGTAPAAASEGRREAPRSGAPSAQRAWGRLQGPHASEGKKEVSDERD